MAKQRCADLRQQLSHQVGAPGRPLWIVRSGLGVAGPGASFNEHSLEKRGADLLAISPGAQRSKNEEVLWWNNRYGAIELRPSVRVPPSLLTPVPQSELLRFLAQVRTNRALQQRLDEALTADEVSLLAQELGFLVSGSDILRFSGQSASGIRITRIDHPGEYPGRYY